jgi:hypothetical protein
VLAECSLCVVYPLIYIFFFTIAIRFSKAILAGRYFCLIHGKIIGVTTEMNLRGPYAAGGDHFGHEPMIQYPITKVPMADINKNSAMKKQSNRRCLILLDIISFWVISIIEKKILSFFYRIKKYPVPLDGNAVLFSNHFNGCIAMVFIAIVIFSVGFIAMHGFPSHVN